MLLRMYLRYAERRGFKAEVLDHQPGEEAGLKSATVRFEGAYAYGNLSRDRRPPARQHQPLRLQRAAPHFLRLGVLYPGGR